MKTDKLKCRGKRTLEQRVDPGFVRDNAPATAAVLRETTDNMFVLQRNYKFKCKNSAHN